MSDIDLDTDIPIEKVEQVLQNLPRLSLGMAYVPYQKWEKPYEVDVGFDRGTLFPELDKPFIGEGVRHG